MQPAIYYENRTLIGMVAGLSLGVTQANLIAAQRPVSDFLSRQGKFCLQLGADGNFDCSASTYVTDTTGGGCFQFIPPVANYMGWSDPKGTSASFDYAGLADIALGRFIGNIYRWHGRGNPSTRWQRHYQSRGPYAQRVSFCGERIRLQRTLNLRQPGRGYSGRSPALSRLVHA